MDAAEPATAAATHSKPDIPLRAIAVIHAAYALLLGIAIVVMDQPASSGDLVEAIPWALFTLPFLAISVGLWKGKSWARHLALFLHWVMLRVALLGLPVSILIIIVAPKTGIAVAFVFAIYAAIAFVALILLSALVVRCLRSTTRSNEVI